MTPNKLRQWVRYHASYYLTTDFDDHEARPPITAARLRDYVALILLIIFLGGFHAHA